jgi:K+-sensing histidine kinase KdpD
MDSSHPQRSMREKAFFALRVAAAGLFCAGVAALISLGFQDHEIEFRAKLPFLLLIPVVLVARKVGEAAAILGTIAAALVFAMLLFQPLNNVAVANKPARASLAWFLLGGMVCAHLLSPPSARTRRTSDFARRDSDFE